MIDSRAEWEKYLMRIEHLCCQKISKCLKPMIGGCRKEIEANLTEFPMTKPRIIWAKISIILMDYKSHNKISMSPCQYKYIIK